MLFGLVVFAVIVAAVFFLAATYNLGAWLAGASIYFLSPIFSGFTKRIRAR